jgi:hypothetical protein
MSSEIMPQPWISLCKNVLGTSHVESANQGSKYIQGYFDKEYAITNPQGVTQNLDFT